MRKSRSQSPFSAKFQNPPRKPVNRKARSREYLTCHEVEDLRKAARAIGRHGHRDDALILLMFRHGLRISELIALRWDQVDLKQGLLHVVRLKNGKPATHPVYSVEIRALRKLQRDYPDSRYLFVSERMAPLTARSVHHIIARAGQAADFGFSVHPHMLRHSTGFYLANKGTDTRTIQAYLGHSNINNTVIYTQLSPNRFKNLWQD